MEYSWISVPESNILENKSRWASCNNNIFAGLRHILLVVEQNPVVKSGPLVDQVEWPINSEFTFQHRNKNVIKYTAGINESITSAITQQLSTEIISKVNSSLSVGKVLESVLSLELTEKVNKQLTESLSRGLSTTKSFETQEETEITQTLKFNVLRGKKGKDTRNVNIYKKVKEIRWDVYLYKSDYLQLQYKKNWIWKDVRRTIQSDSALLKQPLFSIIFFEPIPSLSYSFDNFDCEINSITEIKIQKLLEGCPSRFLPAIPLLEELAKLAFPVTKTEKKEVKVREETKRKSSVNSTGGKRFFKKVAAKKAVKRAAPKKIARKATKKAYKRAAPRKAAKKK